MYFNFKINVCMYVCMYVYMNVCGLSWRPGEGVRFPGTGDTSSFELLDIGAGN